MPAFKRQQRVNANGKIGIVMNPNPDGRGRIEILTVDSQTIRVAENKVRGA